MTSADRYARISVTQEDGIAVLTLASDKVNALDVETIEEITSAVDACEGDAEVRALVLTGQGAIFSAGLNVGEVVDHDKDRTEVLLDALSTMLVHLFRFPKPTVAAVNGPAVAGGCVLACACDKRLIAEGARIGATQLKVGVSFPIVAIELLRHACGSGAEQLVLDAALLDAEEAVRRGLAHRVVPADRLQAEAVTVAETLAGLDASAYALAKVSIRRPALDIADDPAGRALDRQVLEQWQEDRTRASLGRFRAPKG